MGIRRADARHADNATTATQGGEFLSAQPTGDVCPQPDAFPPPPAVPPGLAPEPSGPPADGHGYVAGEQAAAGNGDAGQEAAPARRRRKWGPPAVDAPAGGDAGGAAAPPAAGSATSPTPPPEGAGGGADGDGGEGAAAKRRRRSRWEENDGSAAANTALAVVPAAGGAMMAVFPREVVLSGGIKVSLPPTITGEQPLSHADPKVRALHEELESLNRKLQNNDLDIPPEGDPRRSPSPEPVYDRNGIRQNTREIRYRERLVDNRNRVVEELMREDASFKPPADYRSALLELGGAPPPEMMGDLSALEARDRPGLGSSRPRRPGDDLPDDHKIYIAGLPPVFNDAMLRSMFEPFGNVLHAVVATDGAGNSRGFGFVHMPDAATAKAARDGMDGRTIEGKALTVRLRSERPEPRQRGPGGGGGPGGLEGVDDACKLYLGQLPHSATEERLRPLFEPYGAILELRLIRDRDTGALKGFGFLTMATPPAASAVMRALHGHRLDGKSIVVKPAGQPPGSGGGGGERGPPPPGGDHHHHRDPYRGPKHDGPGRMMGPGGPPPYPPGPAPPPGGPPPPHYPPPGGPYPPGGPPPHYPPPHYPHAPGYPPPYPGAYPPPGAGGGGDNQQLSEYERFMAEMQGFRS
ncbi:hypothetical protein GPECTOR_8g399 [Gonium pectorale]|uniref:RRM domain-containing protein n=1 Tax=Gonium pectorale TaxID=33097 RepID=A0A150GTI1_GONPE|nr:hypothetical protein GPECTOR_8g399 [Gonium pectorale]|eukprot:KXZ53032.1 hypothetical protein GPECTOR_8g399 [Gonium pectorale]